MPAIVADNDVISFDLKADSRAELYRSYLQDNTVIITFMTVAELELWMLRYNWGEVRRARMEARLSRYRVPHVNRNLCRLWAEVTDACRKAGRPIATADAWHAATALAFDVRLVTHNAKDYAGVSGLQIIISI